jgi:hypothetical protein
MEVHMIPIVWALQLRNVSPTAKLVAIAAADCPCSDGEKEGKAIASAEWLQDWSCTSDDEFELALSELDSIGVKIWVEDGHLAFEFPIQIYQHQSQKLAPISSIYVISGGGLTKVGISRNPENRFKNLQASNPHAALTLDFHLEGDLHRIRKAEKQAHNTLVGYLVGNEWFSVTPEKAIGAVQNALDAVRGLPE